MKRAKTHKIKQELPESSTSRSAIQKEHDLAYYIHDRVELMHQVFSVLKPKELKAMAPDCVRHISISDLQELCMEELLGISSKRLCAILDGAPPPSDTESSSESEHLETISLDSISSDDEILSQVTTKKTKKRKHHSKSKSKKSKSKNKEVEDKEQADRSRRAGLTVLELLELQARARAIRAQLQQEQIAAASTSQPSESATGNSSDDEVEIKEEAAEVVEISSEEEKPNIKELEEILAAACKQTQDTSNSKTVTKKVNDLIITVPKTNTSKKIKLRRNNSVNTKSAEEIVTSKKAPAKASKSVVVGEEHITKNVTNQRPNITEATPTKSQIDTRVVEVPQSKSKSTKIDVNTRDKSKKKKKRKVDTQKDKEGSDDDEITLQLSDSEKMDLLEDLDGKKSDKCNYTEDSCSDSSNEDLSQESKQSEGKENKRSNNTDVHNDTDVLEKETSKNRNISEIESVVNSIISINMPTNEEESLKNKSSDLEIAENDEVIINVNDNDADCGDVDKSNTCASKDNTSKSDPNYVEDRQNETSDENTIDMSCSYDIQTVMSEADVHLDVNESVQATDAIQDHKIINIEAKTDQFVDERNSKQNEEQRDVINNADEVLRNATSNKALSSTKSTVVDVRDTKGDKINEKSEGELSDRDSSEVEASDLKPVVVCISDDDEKKGKKKKKKDKKAKKEKKSKKKKDFRESADQNFDSEINTIVSNQTNTLQAEGILIMNENNDVNSKCQSIVIDNVLDSQCDEVKAVFQTKPQELKDVQIEKSEITKTDTDLDDAAYEILELSDDSSCYGVEEISISKEPTAEEIEALSAKVDELERDRASNSESQEGKVIEELDNVSWKDRYLKSSKVQKVLTTANIINAMRKKNLELKKKLQESRTKSEVVEENKAENIELTSNNLEDGSIEQYNTLETSTKYVDPVKEVDLNIDNGTESEKDADKKAKKDTVSLEMKKEAKQLLKMYKRLMKFNKESKPKDPNRKKKKKKSKDKDKDKDKDIVKDKDKTVAKK